MPEELTQEICDEYRKKVLALNDNSATDVGQRRILRKELQERCGIPEIWATNIINGYRISDYLTILEMKKRGEAGIGDTDFLERLARMEEKEKRQKDFEFEEE